jgi:hypothetical protein
MVGQKSYRAYQSEIRLIDTRRRRAFEDIVAIGQADGSERTRL